MTNPEDIVLKFTYEQVYGQILTVSDPRYTHSSDPNYSSTDYDRTVTRFEYRGPITDSFLLLDRIICPTPIFLDDRIADPVIYQFLEYDTRGRLTKSKDPTGVVTDYSFYEPADGILERYPKRIVVDPNGLAIATEYGYDDFGRLISIKSPQATQAPAGQFITTISYNNHDQIIETTSPSPFNFRIRSFYDRHGNLERVERDIKDENGLDMDDSPQVRTYQYDTESRLIKSTVGGVQLSSHLKTLFRYDCAGNKIMTTLPGGNQIKNVYNELMMPIAQIIGFNSDSSSKTSVDYDDDGRISQTVSAKGNATLFSYDTFGHIA